MRLASRSDDEDPQVRTAVSACTYDANSTSACDRICSGTLPPGAACTRDSDCAQPADGSATCMLVGPMSTARDVCVFHPDWPLRATVVVEPTVPVARLAIVPRRRDAEKIAVLGDGRMPS
jgi:hypothetical protein